MILRLKNQEAQRLDAEAKAKAEETRRGADEYEAAKRTEIDQNLRALDQKKAEAQQEADRIRSEARNEADHIVHSAKLQADRLGREAADLYVRKVREADDHWNKITGDLEQFYDEHQGLREMLKMIGSVQT